MLDWRNWQTHRVANNAPKGIAGSSPASGVKKEELMKIIVVFKYYIHDKSFMTNPRTRNKGWQGESQRHSLASKGVKTSRKAGFKLNKQGVLEKKISFQQKQEEEEPDIITGLAQDLLSPVGAITDAVDYGFNETKKGIQNTKDKKE